MKLISDASEYALRAVVWLAQRPGESQKTREIAAGTRAAPGYLVKVLQNLAKAGILSAQRGSHGGFRLERAADELTVLEIINAVDPIERIHTCPLGIAAHGKDLCPMHRRIDEAMALIERTFQSVTVSDLLREASDPEPGCDFLTRPRPVPLTASASGPSSNSHQASASDDAPARGDPYRARS